MLSKCSPCTWIIIIFKNEIRKQVQRVLSRHRIIATQLLYADSHSKPFVSAAAASLFSSASFAGISREGSLFRYSRDITVEQMASVHPPLSVSTFLHALPAAFFLAHALIHRLRLWFFRFMVSLAAFRPSLSPTAILPRSPFPFISRAWWSRKSRSVLTREDLHSSLPPPISEPGPYVSPKTNDDLLAFAVDM